MRLFDPGITNNPSCKGRDEDEGFGTAEATIGETGKAEKAMGTLLSSGLAGQEPS